VLGQGGGGNLARGNSCGLVVSMEKFPMEEGWEENEKKEELKIMTN
jgi:hypothetical protein